MNASVQQSSFRLKPGVGASGTPVPMGPGYRQEKKFWVPMGTGYRSENKFWVPMGPGYRPEKNFWVPMGIGYRENFQLCRPLVKTKVHR